MAYFSLLVPLGLQTTAVVNLKWFVLADQLYSFFYLESVYLNLIVIQTF